MKKLYLMQMLVSEIIFVYSVQMICIVFTIFSICFVIAKIFV